MSEDSALGRATPPRASGLEGLRVALVHDWLTGRRGGEKCLEVLCESFPEAALHTLLHVPGAAGAAIENRTIQTSLLQRVPGIERRYRSLLALMPLAARGWRVGEVDLVVSFSHCVAKSVRVPRGVPHVCYCFTPMRYAWDERQSYLATWSKRPLKRALASVALNRLRSWDRRTASGVTHFVSISETVRNRIVRSYGRDSHVIQPPVDTDFYQPDISPRDDYYLVVSALVPYKRVEHAILACQAAGRRLVVIGEGPDRARLQSLATHQTQLLGWQSDHVIRDHLRRCRALLFPGVEDFGIVPIEALACGTPVIALNDGAVPETVDNRVGRVYEEPTAHGLERAILEWEQLGRPNDAALARELAVRFARPRFRERLLSYLAHVVATHGTHRDLQDHLPAPHLPTMGRRGRIAAPGPNSLGKMRQP